MSVEQFSPVIAGCMSWGSWGKDFSIHEMTSLLNFCVESGITSFDHADIYGAYTTEKSFGKALKQSDVKRNQIQLISKCGIQYVAESRNNKIKHYNYTKEYIVWSVEESLRNLQTDFIDLYLLHRPSPLMQAEEIAAAIDQLKTQGKIKQFGVSNFTVSQMQLLQTCLPIEVNQIEISLTHFESLFSGSLVYMQGQKIRPMAWSPLGSYFTNKNEQNSRISTVVRELTEKYNATENQILLAWLLKHPAGIIPVVGTTNTQRLQNALASKELDLEIEDWFALLVASQGHKVP